MYRPTHRHTYTHAHVCTLINIHTDPYTTDKRKINNKPSMIDNWYLEIGYCIQIKTKLYQTSIIIKVKK